MAPLAALGSLGQPPSEESPAISQPATHPPGMEARPSLPCDHRCVSVFIIYCCITSYPQRSLKPHLLSHSVSEGRESGSSFAGMGIWGLARAGETESTPATPCLPRSPLVQPRLDTQASLLPSQGTEHQDPEVLGREPPQALIKQMGKLAPITPRTCSSSRIRAGTSAPRPGLDSLQHIKSTLQPW